MTGIARGQAVLMPQRVDDYVDQSSVVRFIDEFVRTLPMDELGFERVVPAETGRPGYDPRIMLSLWIYGYVNGLTSSRKLERETGRNVEVMWLLEVLQPDFKTISDFRKDNKKALCGVFRKFTEMCRNEGLVSGELVAAAGPDLHLLTGRGSVVLDTRLLAGWGLVPAAGREFAVPVKALKERPAAQDGLF